MRLKQRAAQLTLLPEARLASPPAWQDDGREVLTCDGSGLSFSASAARLLPAGSWQRTLSESLASSLTGSTGCAVSLRVRATNCGRSLLVPTMSGRPTGGSACGLSPGSDWPTVTANESPTRFNQGGSNGHVGPKRPMLAGAVALWPTVHGMDNEGNPRRNGPTGNELGRAVTREERAGLLAPGSPSTSGKRRGWPSPNAALAEGGHGVKDCTETGAKPDGSKASVDLSDMAKRETGRGSLNPAWVSQLMGFPTGWLAASPPDTAARRLKASAIRLSRKLRK